MPNLEYYTSRFSFDKGRNDVWIEVSRYLQKYVSQGSTVLDLGAGYCSFINNIKAKDKYAVDLFEGFKEYANKDIKTFIGSCMNLKQFKKSYFDVVFSSNLFEHLTLEEAETTLKEVIRVLKPKGRFIVIQPNFRYCYKNYFDDYTHKTIYTDSSLADLLKSNKFKIIRREGKFLPFSLKSKLPKSKVFVRIYLNMPFRPLAKQMLIIGEKV
ncbi:class I SAM-dependent methyltransferase [Candidatus Woesearchaeota archaeon]|nr:class I SAM-dependent methyltransferase [Candidatus Woesearchaeota archaeon]